MSIPDDHEKGLLRDELKRLKQEQESNKKTFWFVSFLAVWLLPMLGMKIVQQDDLECSV
jgi:hypothetical protein